MTKARKGLQFVTETEALAWSRFAAHALEGCHVAVDVAVNEADKLFQVYLERRDSLDSADER